MEKDLRDILLKDLCSRLPYGVKIQYHHIQETITDILIDINMFGRVNIYGHIKDICDVKPYLFPLSNMTEKEKKEYYNLCIEEEREEIEFGEWVTRVYYHNTIESIDWLNKNHFDYHNLIEQGLAIEAPEGMYN